MSLLVASIMDDEGRSPADADEVAAAFVAGRLLKRIDPHVRYIVAFVCPPIIFCVILYEFSLFFFSIKCLESNPSFN